MAQNKYSKTAVGSHNKRPNIRSTSVLSGTSIELQYPSYDDSDDDEPTAASKVGNRPVNTLRT